MIQKMAQPDDRQNQDRRHNDDPDFQGHVDRRQNDRRHEQAPATESIRHPHRQSSVFSPENFRLISFHKIVPGSFYAKVLNDNTKQYVEFGKLIIAGYIPMERGIAHYNETHGATIPLLSENILYHIEQGNLVPANSRYSQFKVFENLFNKAKTCTESESRVFTTNNPVDHSEAVFTKNVDSPLFAHAKYRAKITNLAKRKKA